MAINIKRIICLCFLLDVEAELSLQVASSIIWNAAMKTAELAVCICL
jgi:hypothetical protein